MDWDSYLHTIRATEIDRIFGRCPSKLFASGLELGAGDGHQSELLISYAKHLTVTDWDVARLRRRPEADVQACDAEAVENAFAPGTFDLVFSSNLLEHLPAPGAALRGIHTVLKDDGVTIHVMPNPFWKFSYLSLLAPVRIGRRLNRALRRSRKPSRTVAAVTSSNNPMTNSPCTEGRRWNFWPAPHGAYRGNWEELWAFRRR